VNLFSPLPSEVRDVLDGLPALIDTVFPLPGRFRQALPADVAELSRLLTGGRGERPLSYLGKPGFLSAYLRYFLPWNVYRLCRLLPSLNIPLASGDLIIDLGSGPLTLAAALWISRRDLRDLPLEFRCIDRSGPALEAGKKLFSAITGGLSPWKIRTIRGSFGGPGGKLFPAERPGQEKPAALIGGVNVFNEICGGIPHSDSESLKRAAIRSARLLAPEGDRLPRDVPAILVVEPGIPLGGNFISLLRDALIEKNRIPLSPCPHAGACPFPGGMSRTGKKRWCHFAFGTEDAPGNLHRLSAAAGIPKERGVLSFLLAGPPGPEAQTAGPRSAGPETAPPDQVRIISDPFPLPRNRFGRYGCSAAGLVLAEGNRAAVEGMASGDLVRFPFKAPGRRDPKSGALLVSAD
jgi:hypothetical protein